MPDESAQDQPMSPEKRGSSRPEYKPQRKPESLSANPQKRARQLETIALSPTETQRAQVAAKIKTENDNIGDDYALKMAEAHFANYEKVSREARVQQDQVRAAASDALKAKTNEELHEKRQVLQDLKDQARRVTGERDEMAKWFKDVGLKVEPEQSSPGLTIGEKMEKGTFIAGYEGARAASGAKDLAKGGVEAGKRGVKKGVEIGDRGVKKGKELAGAGIKATKEGARKTAAGTRNYAQDTGSAMGEMYRQDWQDIQGAAKSGKEAVRSGAGIVAEAARREARTFAQGKDVQALLRVPGEIKEGTAKAWKSTIEAGRRVIGGVVKTAREQIRVGTTNWQTSVNELKSEVSLIGTTAGAGAEKTKSFLGIFKRKVDTGLEGAGNALNVKLEPWGEKVSGQLDRFNENVVKKVVEEARETRSAMGEMYRQDWQDVQSPFKNAWEAIERERPAVREKTGLLTGKLAIVVEAQKDKAAPIIAAISGIAQEKADRLFGKPARFLRMLGGKGMVLAEMATSSPRIEAIKGKIEGWAGQANEARKRLGEFMGKMGRKLNSGPNASITWDEQEMVTPESQKEAGSWINNSKETIGRFFEGVQKWQVFEAVRRWRESGMTDRDISRREKIMRVIHAASLGRGAAIAGATLVEGAKFAGEHKKITAAVLVGAGALAYAILGHPDLAGTVSSIVSGLSGGQEVASSLSPDSLGPLAATMPGVESAQAVGNLASPEALISANSSVDLANSSGGEAARAVAGASPVSPDVIPTGSNIDLTNAGGNEIGRVEKPVITSPTLEAQEGFTNQTPNPPGPSGLEPPPGAATGPAAQAEVQLPNQLPRAGELLFNPTDILKGENVYPQAERIASQLPGGASIENVTRVMGQIFSNFQQEFVDSAQTIVNSTDPATNALKADAQRQLDAIAQIRQNPQSANQYATLADAVHFWSK